MKASSMNPDQTTSKGAVLSRSIFFVINANKVYADVKPDDSFSE